MPQPQPFWICHQCGAQMRPLMIDGVAHCASCNSEFVEILDAEINPDPRHELPPPPPTRPGPAPAVPPRPANMGGGGPRPAPATPYGHGGNDDNGGGGGMLAGILNMFGGGNRGSGVRHGPTPSEHMPFPPQGANRPGSGSPAGRSWEWNLGGGTVRIQGYSGPVFTGFPPTGYSTGAPMGAAHRADPNHNFDAFFGAGRRGGPSNAMGAGQGPPDDVGPGLDLLRGLAEALRAEGVLLDFQYGHNRDYVASDTEFNDVLATLMQAAGPQGPLPASRETIDSLERFTFDNAKLAECENKTCSVCWEDYAVGDPGIRVPCGHMFHPDCLVQWLETNGSCPVCRYSLVSSDEGRQRAQGATQGAAQQADAGAQGAAGVEDQRAQDGQGSQDNDGPLYTGFQGLQGMLTGMLHNFFGQAGTQPAEGQSGPSAASEGPTAPASSTPHDTARGSSQATTQHCQAPSGAPVPAPAPPLNPNDPFGDPPDAELPVPETPSRPAPGGTTSSSAESSAAARARERPLPQWAQLARGMRQPGQREPHEASAPASSSSPAAPGAASVDSNPDHYDLRARDNGEIALIPWGSPNHQHVTKRYALLGGDAGDEEGEPLLFCHAHGPIGDFSMLHMRRVAGRIEGTGDNAVEGHVCCHSVRPGVAGDKEIGTIMRDCPGPPGGDVHASLRYSGPDPSSEIDH